MSATKTMRLKAPVQTSLSFAEPEHRSSVRRVALDASSWVEHHRRWLASAERLLETLASEAPWEQRTRWMVDQRVIEPRLTAEYHALDTCTVPELAAASRRLSEQWGVDYDRAWLNLYRDHHDSTSWHADVPARTLPSCIVPVLSLGETRRFLVRRAAGGPSTTFLVESGDLIVMGGRCQRDWVHAVPKEARAKGSRISINFASSRTR